MLLYRDFIINYASQVGVPLKTKDVHFFPNIHDVRRYVKYIEGMCRDGLHARTERFTFFYMHNPDGKYTKVFEELGWNDRFDELQMHGVTPEIMRRSTACNPCPWSYIPPHTMTYVEYMGAI